MHNFCVVYYCAIVYHHEHNCMLMSLTLLLYHILGAN